MKKGLLAVAFCVLLFVFALPVSAEAAGVQDLYDTQYQKSGADALGQLLPEQTRQALEQLQLDPADSGSMLQLQPANVFSVIWNFLKSGAERPMRVTLVILGALMIFAALDGLMGDKSIGATFAVFLGFVTVLTLLEPVRAVIGGAASAMQGLSAFMLAFVPVFAGICISSGQVAAAGSFSAILLGVAEGMAQLVAYGFVPAIGGCMCLGICSGLSPVGGLQRICELFKKTSLWVMSVATTVFLAVLSVQTSIGAAADNLTLRTSKAIVSGAIPVMGPAIAESLNTAKGCLQLLRSGVGIYGVVAVVLLMLPLVAELLLWRAGLWLCGSAGEILSAKLLCNLFKSVDFCLSILIGALTFTAVLFILSLTIIMKTGGG